MSRKEEKGGVSDAAPPPEEEKPSEASQATGAGPGEAGAGDETADEQADALQKIAALEQQVADLKDQVLRRAADYENFRKRMARDREEAVAYANQMLMLDLVPVIDDFERAFTSAESSRDFDAFHDGVQLIERQLSAMLEKKWSLTRFASLGEPFDPHRHQALASEESDQVGQPTVVEEYQKGYMFRDRVLRPAKVKVAQPRPRTADQANA